jgi:hypothetical protein
VIPVIELFGLPGSGKTFLNELLKAELTSRHYLKIISREESSLEGLKRRNDGTLSCMIKRLPPQLWHKIVNEDYCLQELLRFAAQRPRFFSYIFSILKDKPVPEEHIRSILGAVSRTVVEFELTKNINKLSDLVLLADEWFIHRFFTVWGNCRIKPSLIQIREYIHLSPRSHCVVFVATPPELCIERMEQRQRFPNFLRNIAIAETKLILENSFTSLCDIVNELKNQERSVFVYDGDVDDIEVVSNYCLKCLAS